MTIFTVFKNVFEAEMLFKDDAMNKLTGFALCCWNLIFTL